jgi:cell wall-associated NlpC family hydrolase
MLLAGCARTPAPPVAPAPSAAGSAAIVARALDLVGTPYRAGGTSPATGFDCSGLVHYVYREVAGLELPRTTAGLDALRAPASGGLQPGDLVLFDIERNDRADHAGIYLGDDTFIHAPSSGGRVRVEALTKRYWQRSYRGARRLLP